jgi:hypothetical protein
MSPARHVSLRTKALLRLDAEASTDRWHALFLEAGLLTTVTRAPEPGSPVRLLLAARDTLLELEATEVQFLEARAPVGGIGNHAPTWAWVAALAVPVISWQLTALGETSEEMLWAFGFGVWTAMAIAVIGLAWVGTLELRSRREHREAVAALQARIVTLRAGLTPAAQAVLSCSFLARVGTRLVVSTPHLAWLHSCTAAARRALADRAASDEIRALIDQLEGCSQRIEAAKAVLLEFPPESWSSEGLEPDLAGLRIRAQALGVKPNPLCRALLHAWGDELSAEE